MPQVRISCSALVSLAAGLQLKSSTWLSVHKSVLTAVMLALLVGGVLLTVLAHPALTGPGCGANCLLRA
ncbi:MAG: hypothetical protein ABI406_14870 [Ktedonobacteraceae bacterium]